jgi:hypothetical protein
VRKYLELGLEAPVYGPRRPRARVIEPYERYLQERVQAFPDLSGARLLREIRELGYEGAYTAVTDFLREVRPARQAPFERRFETPPGKQAQVDFAEFTVEFTDEPGVVRKVWLFSLVLGHSRWLWLRISEFPDSDFTNSRTAVSVNPGQSGDGWSLRCGYCSVVMISGFSGWVNWVLLPFFRMLSPVSSMRWALWMMRSRIASAMVGSPII